MVLPFRLWLHSDYRIYVGRNTEIWQEDAKQPNKSNMFAIVVCRLLRSLRNHRFSIKKFCGRKHKQTETHPNDDSKESMILATCWANRNDIFDCVDIANVQSTFWRLVHFALCTFH